MTIFEESKTFHIPRRLTFTIQPLILFIFTSATLQWKLTGKEFDFR